MKSTKARKSAASKDGRAKRGVVSRALRFVGDHPKATAGVLAAGVGAYALLRRGKKAAGKAAKSRRAASRTRTGAAGRAAGK
jgi:hypothetical protein